MQALASVSLGGLLILLGAQPGGVGEVFER
jgi:hypothetical protein